MTFIEAGRLLGECGMVSLIVHNLAPLDIELDLQIIDIDVQENEINFDTTSGSFSIRDEEIKNITVYEKAIVFNTNLGFSIGVIPD